jgi:hypothetical protein
MNTLANGNAYGDAVLLQIGHLDAKIEVFTVMNNHVIVFWVVTPCSDVMA